MSGVPVVRPVPWTVSRGEDPPQLALVAVGAALDEQAATTIPAVSSTTTIPAVRAAVAALVDFSVSPMPY